MHIGSDLHPQRRVEIREGLVEQEHRRPRGQGPRQGDPLLLTTRQRVGQAIVESGEPDHRHHLVDPFTGAGHAMQPVGDVLGAQ